MKTKKPIKINNHLRDVLLSDINTTRIGETKCINRGIIYEYKAVTLAEKKEIIRKLRLFTSQRNGRIYVTIFKGHKNLFGKRVFDLLNFISAILFIASFWAMAYYILFVK